MFFSVADDIKFRPSYDCRRIFSDADEVELRGYLVTASRHHHGLTCLAARQLAYQYAHLNQKTILPSWEENESAGKDWLQGFFKRTPQISLRAPESTSLARATSFNKTNVKSFFDNLGVLDDKISVSATFHI